MNKYLLKIANTVGVLKSELGMPLHQTIPNQTLQALSQSADPTMRRQAKGTMNLKSKGEDNHPRNTSKLPQKMPGTK